MWWFAFAAVAAPPAGFVEVEAPGPGPWSWGPYFVCSVPGDPTCVQLVQHGSGGPWSSEPWTPPRPPDAGPLRQYHGVWQRVSVALDADGVAWFQQRDAWIAAPDTRGTRRIDGNGGLFCGTTATGAWCAEVASPATERTALKLGAVSELAVDVDLAAFAVADGRVAVVYHPMSSVETIAEDLVWMPALKGTQSLAVVSAAKLACGLSAEGRIVCATPTAPSEALSLGSEPVGGERFYAANTPVPTEGVRFVALSSVHVALLALADDGRLFWFRPPDEGGEVVAADGVALVDGCVVRRSGPWWCAN